MTPHTTPEKPSVQSSRPLRDQEASPERPERHPVVDSQKEQQQQTGVLDPPASPVWWCSPEKRLHNFQPPTADYSQEDIHDLVTEDEFMHALGLLTVREWEEVLAKRYERRKHTAHSHIFSNTIWEKPETRRKRRAWLTSGAGSPPMLRRKVRPPSQPPSQPQSRPASPTQSSCSPMTTCPLSQPASPQSLEEDYPSTSQPSEEICPMCKIKGADVQCDGCGVVYHGQCVDLEDSEPPPCWLCLTCEQLGLRASSSSQSDPHHLSRRREMLAVRERLLRQRAELTIAKLQLEEKKHHLSLALQAQRAERMSLQQKEADVRKAITQLQNFISTFQKPPPEPRSPTEQFTPPAHSVPSSPTSSPPSSSPPLPACSGVILSQPSSPSQSSHPSLSPAINSPLPTRIASCITSPSLTSPSMSSSLSPSSQSSSSPMTSSIILSQSPSPRPVAPQSFVLGSASRPPSPTQRASHGAHLQGVTISASPLPSPKQSHYSLEKHQVEAKAHVHNHLKRVRPPPLHPHRDGDLHALIPADDVDGNSEPTDLSFPRQNRLSGIRRGESKAMAASS
ncbi:hypothetical protein O3P69_008885 [Scylla paramamosain]|uniref:PHD-type domain-containing protein n=2 Tax=Scylla paramamosain TaxID=85552 RepID=A0AAW0TS40_SCYPA